MWIALWSWWGWGSVLMDSYWWLRGKKGWKHWAAVAVEGGMAVKGLADFVGNYLIIWILTHMKKIYKFQYTKLLIIYIYDKVLPDFNWLRILYPITVSSIIDYQTNFTFFLTALTILCFCSYFLYVSMFSMFILGII